jgi:tetratricopeptide (TPR) repeat protein
MEKMSMVCRLWVLMLLGLVLSGCVSNAYKPGWDYYRSGEPERAVQFFQGKEIACDPCLCKIHIETGQYEKAVKYCESALKTWKEVKRTEYGDINQFFESGLLFEAKATRVDRLCTAYEQTAQFGRAAEVLRQYLTADNPNDAGGFSRLSVQYIHNRQYDEAVTAAKRAIGLEPANAQAYNNLAYAYSHKNQRAETLAAIKKAIELDPSNAYFRQNMGSFLLEWDDYAPAAEAYRKAIELQPASADCLIGLASSLRLMGRYDDALAVVDKLIELQTIRGIGLEIAVEAGQPAVRGVLAGGPAKMADIQAGDRILRIDGKPQKGLTIEQVVQGLRGPPGTQVTLTIERKGLGETLEKTLTRGVIVIKAAACSFGTRSMLQRYKGNREESFRDAQKASSLDPADHWTLLALGGAQLDRGNYREAIQTLSQAKEGTLARVLEATAYARLGKMKDAARIYDAIAEDQLSPKNVPLMREVAALLQALAPYVRERRDKAKGFEAKGQYKEALAELSEALKAAGPEEAEQIQGAIFGIARRTPSLSELPEEARKHSLRGEVLIKEGNFAQAAAEFKKAIQIAPYTARLYYNFALINAELKKYPEAIRNMKLYLQAAPDAPDIRAAKDEIIKWEFAMEKAK